MASKYIREVRDKIRILQQAGVDIELRNGYGLWGICSKDENRDYSVLFTPKELLIYLTGFQYAWFNKERLIAEPEPVAEVPVADSEPVYVLRHDWAFKPNGLFCKRCNAQFGGEQLCR